MGVSQGKLQLWGGIECTVNRVGARYFDQLEFSGHRDRLGDLDLVADLGLRTLRYPLIWERAEASGALDFGWSDARAARLRELAIDPDRRTRASRRRTGAHLVDQRLLS